MMLLALDLSKVADNSDSDAFWFCLQILMIIGYCHFNCSVDYQLAQVINSSCLSLQIVEEGASVQERL